MTASLRYSTFCSFVTLKHERKRLFIAALYVQIEGWLVLPERNRAY